MGINTALITRNNSAVLAGAVLFSIAVSLQAVRTGNPLLLFALALPAAFLLSVKAPFIFPLGVYAFLLPFDSVFVVSGDSPERAATITKYLGLSCIVVLAFKGLAERRLKSPRPVVFWWVAYIAWAVFSCLWAMDLDVSAFFARSVTASGLVLLYLAVSVYPLNEKEYGAFKKFILYGGLAAAAYVVYEYSVLRAVSPGDVMERASLASARNMADPENMTDPNQFAYSLLIPFGIGLQMLLKPDTARRRILYAAITAVLGYAVVLSGSRGGALGAVIVSAVLIFSLARRARVLVAAAALAAALVYLAPESYFERMKTDTVERGGAGRLEIWKVGAEAFRNNWLVGVGLDNFPRAYDYYSYDVPGAGFEGYSRAPHSIYLAGAVELGIVGAAIMLLGLAGNFRLIRRSPDASDRALLTACFLGCLVQAATLDVIWRKSFWLLWMLIIIHDLMEPRDENPPLPCPSPARGEGIRK